MTKYEIILYWSQVDKAFIAEVNGAKPKAAHDEYRQKRDNTKPSDGDAAFPKITGWIDIGCRNLIRGHS